MTVTDEHKQDSSNIMINDDPATTSTTTTDLGVVPDIPSKYICPLTLEIMQDPVLSRYGQSYERTAIVQWLSKGSGNHACCPLTRQPLNLSGLITHHLLRNEILRWQQQAQLKQPQNDIMSQQPQSQLQQRESQLLQQQQPYSDNSFSYVEEDNGDYYPNNARIFGFITIKRKNDNGNDDYDSSVESTEVSDSDTDPDDILWRRLQGDTTNEEEEERSHPQQQPQRQPLQRQQRQQQLPRQQQQQQRQHPQRQRRPQPTANPRRSQSVDTERRRNTTFNLMQRLVRGGRN